MTKQELEDLNRGWMTPEERVKPKEWAKQMAAMMTRSELRSIAEGIDRLTADDRSRFARARRAA